MPRKPKRSKPRGKALFRTLLWQHGLNSRDLKAGDRVRFTGIWDRYPDVFVNSGETGVVVENSLNEMQPTLFVRPDSPELRQMVKEWDELIHVYGPIHPDENDNAPLIRIDDERPLMQLP